MNTASKAPVYRTLRLDRTLAFQCVCLCKKLGSSVFLLLNQACQSIPGAKDIGGGPVEL